MEEKFKKLDLPEIKTKHISNQLLYDLYFSLKRADKNWLHGNVNMKRDIFEYNEKNNFNKVPDYGAIHPDIQHSLEKTGSYYCKYNLQIGKNNYVISFFHPGKKNKRGVIENFLEDCIMKIYLWLFIIQPYIRDNCSKEMNAYILFSDHKKVLSNNKFELLDSIHVNTAFTTSCLPKTNMMIYRKEEWFRAFIHETFHNLGLDFSNMNDLTIERKISQLFNVENKHEIRIYESYCETWAEVLNVVIVSFLVTNNKESFKKEFDQNMMLERKYSFFQMAKILDHFDISYNELVSHDKKKVFEEKSHITSYFFIKTILMYFLSNFEHWCKVMNINGIFQFELTKKNIYSFIDFIEKHYQHKNFVQTLHLYEDFFKNNKHSQNAVMKTLRMSLNEL